MNVNEVKVLNLAYLGDAYYELKIREYLVRNFGVKVHHSAQSYVSAKAQAKYLEMLIENNFLNESEMAFVRRGRNTKVKSSPKNVDILTYMHATGFETLIGYLYFENKLERAREIIEEIIAYE